MTQLSVGPYKIQHCRMIRSHNRSWLFDPVMFKVAIRWRDGDWFTLMLLIQTRDSHVQDHHLYILMKRKAKYNTTE